MNCTQCGHELVAGGRFCEACGAPVTPAQPVEQPAASPPVAFTTPATPPPGAPSTTAPTPPAAGHAADSGVASAARTAWHSARDAGAAGFGAAAANPSGIFFVPRLLHFIERGGFFKRVTAGFLYVTAVLYGLAGIVAAFAMLRISFEYASISAILAGILGLVILAVVVYAAAHTIWIRARDIRALPEAELTIVPIFSLMLKLTGELTAMWLTAIGFISLIAALFAAPLMGALPYSYGMMGYGGFGGEGALVAGLLGLFGNLAAGFLILVVFYYLAEMAGVLANIARDVAGTRRAMEDR